MRLTSQRQGMARLAQTGAWILVILVLGGTGVHAQMQAVPAAVVASATVPDTEASSVRLIAGRSTLVDIGVPIARVSLTSAEVADALVTSSSQLLIHGKTPGTISMFVWDRQGAVRRYEVTVARDVARLAEEMHQLLPGEPIDVRSNGKDIVLSGKVSSKEVIERAVNLSTGFVDRKEEIVTLLQAQELRKTNQVLLKVRFAEVSRQAMTELGLSLFTSPTGIENTLGRISTQQFGQPDFSDLNWSKQDKSFGSDVTSASGKITFSDFLNLFVLSEKYDLGVLIKALQTRGLFQSLAEPNLVAESGKEASFLAGGEFPVPVAQGTGGNVAITVQFKEFGVRLNFTPVVDGDRVHLKVRPEVSSLDFANSVVMQGFRIPSLITRRTETEIELRDGQTFAIAGLLNNSMNSTLQKVPGIGDIPVLGYLFRSKQAQKNRTELVVMITPVILPEGSPGVTPNLPRLSEPFLSPQPQNKSIAPPPAAFSTPAPSSALPNSTTSAPAAAAAQPVPSAPSLSGEPAPAAAALPVQPAGEPTVDPGTVVSTAGAASSVEPSKATPADKKALAQQQKQEHARQQAEAKAAAASAKAAAEQAEKEHRAQEAEAKRKAKEAREQADKDAQAAKKTASTTTH